MVLLYPWLLNCLSSRDIDILTLEDRMCEYAFESNPVWHWVLETSHKLNGIAYTKLSHYSGITLASPKCSVSTFGWSIENDPWGIKLGLISCRNEGGASDCLLLTQM